MRLKTRHTTHYRFDDPVHYGLQQLRKTPKTTDQQKVLNWKTTVDAGKKECAFSDHHRNLVELISFEPDAMELTITSEGEVELSDTLGVVGAHRGPAPLWLYLKQTSATQATTGVTALVSQTGSQDALERLHSLSESIREKVVYTVGISAPNWSAQDALDAGKGVCADHTHIFLACARVMNIPARYVSGYLMLNDTTTQDAMHAWAEAHIDGLGWVGFDISNGISPDTRYIRVATGLDYSDAAPISGMRIGGAGEALKVEISVAQQ